MACCGQKRDSLRAQPATQLYQTNHQVPRAPARVEAPYRPAGQSNSAWQLLRYLGRSTATVRGAVSGRMYPFGPSTPVQPVDERDVAGLLATGAFAAVAG
ncbi:MAG: hypothetical protein JWM87_418 [Candidatus Eremiobacteraeota bacterium]|nr:hypothetical protein [Candidatus Eremiobacteraeota bacterium]